VLSTLFQSEGVRTQLYYMERMPISKKIGNLWLKAATFNPRSAQSKIWCGPVYVFAVLQVACILTTCLYFDNLEFDIFDAGSPQCHYTTSVTIAIRILTISVISLS